MDNSVTSSTIAAAMDTSDIASSTTGTTKEAAKAAKEAEKEGLINWAKGLKLEDVILTKERDNGETLGLRKWSALKANIMMSFIKASNIPIGQDLCLGKDLGKNVAKEINCSVYKQKVKTSQSKKKAASVPKKSAAQTSNDSSLVAFNVSSLPAINDNITNDSYWTCGLCSFPNAEDTPVCDMCATRRHK